MTDIDIKAIRAAAEENRFSEYEGDLHEDIAALCDEIEKRDAALRVALIALESEQVSYQQNMDAIKAIQEVLG